MAGIIDQGRASPHPPNGVWGHIFLNFLVVWPGATEGPFTRGSAARPRRNPRISGSFPDAEKPRTAPGAKDPRGRRPGAEQARNAGQARRHVVCGAGATCVGPPRRESGRGLIRDSPDDFPRLPTMAAQRASERESGPMSRDRPRCSCRTPRPNPQRLLWVISRH